MAAQLLGQRAAAGVRAAAGGVGRRGVGSVSRVHSVKVDVAGKALEIETGRVGPLADGMVMARHGESSLMTSAVSSHKISDSGFLPLSVDYREMSYAAGFIPQTWHRKEGMLTDKEVLGARLVDRSIRPFFPKGYAHETQVITTVTSYSPAAPVDTLAINAASAALAISDIPFLGPVAAVRVGWVDGALVVNPTAEELSASQLSLLYAGTAARTAMIEMDAAEIPEPALYEALATAHRALHPLLQAQRDLVAAVGKPPRDSTPLLLPTEQMVVVQEAVYDAARRIYNTHSLAKGERGAAVAALEGDAAAALEAAGHAHPGALLGGAVNSVCRKAFRDILLDEAVATGDHQPILPGLASQDAQHQADGAGGLAHCSLPAHVRVDGRDGDTVRPLSAHVDVFPRVHGSAIFSRGETQCVSTVTLGPPTIAQQLRPVAGGPAKKTFMLHYDFPPYSINETGRVGGANRRMVGHGALAEKAIAPLLPPGEDFPYVIRATSEVSGSDGSSSMATVCAVTLALLDAGVPLADHVAGASVGLITPPGLHKPEAGALCADDARWAQEGAVGEELSDPRYLLLSDIRGLEDHHGDMDFKIAGTPRGITAIQLDVKLPGVPLEVLLQGVAKARVAHGTVLDSMTAVQPAARPALKPTAPRMGLIPVPRDSRGRIIGPGGVILRGIQDATGAALRFLPDAEFLQIFAENEDGVEVASEMVHAILAEEDTRRGPGMGLPPTTRLEVGETVTGRVTKLMDFGVVLGVGDSDDAGLLHVSKMVGRRGDMPEVGAEVRVVVTDVDGLGRAKFSQKHLSESQGRNPRPPVVQEVAQPPVKETQAPVAAQEVVLTPEEVLGEGEGSLTPTTVTTAFPTAPPQGQLYNPQSPTLAALEELNGVEPTPGSFAYLNGTPLVRVRRPGNGNSRRPAKAGRGGRGRRR